MKVCLNCGKSVDSGEWYNVCHSVAPVTGAPTVTATVQEGIEELFQNRVVLQENNGLCERCFHLLSVAISMRRTSFSALEQFISVSSNTSVKGRDTPLMYSHLDMDTKLILQDGINWYSVIADTSNDNLVCYGSSQAMEYVNSVQGLINNFFTFCTDNASSNKTKETEHKMETSQIQNTDTLPVNNQEKHIETSQMQNTCTLHVNNQEKHIETSQMQNTCTLHVNNQEKDMETSQIQNTGTIDINNLEKDIETSQLQITSTQHNQDTNSSNMNSTKTSLPTDNQSKTEDHSQSSDLKNKGQSSDLKNKGQSSDLKNKGQSSDLKNKGQSTDLINKGQSSDLKNKGQSTDLKNKGQRSDLKNKGQSTDLINLTLVQQVTCINDTETNLKEKQKTVNGAKALGNSEGFDLDALCFVDGQKTPDHDLENIESTADSDGQSRLKNDVIEEEPDSDSESRLENDVIEDEHMEEMKDKSDICLTESIVNEPSFEERSKEMPNLVENSTDIPSVTTSGNSVIDVMMPVISPEGVSLAVKALIRNRKDEKIKDQSRTGSGNKNEENSLESLETIDKTKTSVSLESGSIDDEIDSQMFEYNTTPIKTHEKQMDTQCSMTSHRRLTIKSPIEIPSLDGSSKKVKTPQTENSNLVTKQYDNIKSSFSRNRLSTEKFVSPEKQKEIIETSRNAVEKYKKIIDGTKCKKLDRSEDIELTDAMLNVFESPILNQNIVDNVSPTTITTTNEIHQKAKLGSKEDRIARLRRITDNIRARNSGKTKLERAKLPRTECSKVNSIAKTLDSNFTASVTIATNTDINVCNVHTDDPKHTSSKEDTAIQNTVVDPTKHTSSQEDTAIQNTVIDATKTFKEQCDKTEKNVQSEHEKVKSCVLEFKNQAYSNTGQVKQLASNGCFAQKGIHIVENDTEHTRNSLTTLRNESKKSPWSLKINIRKKPNPAKLKPMSEQTLETKKDELPTNLQGDKENELLSEEVFDEMQKSFHPKMLKRKKSQRTAESGVESQKENLSVLTREILENLQPVVLLNRLSSKQIKQLSSTYQKHTARRSKKTKSNQCITQDKDTASLTIGGMKKVFSRTESPSVAQENVPENNSDPPVGTLVMERGCIKRSQWQSGNQSSAKETDDDISTERSEVNMSPLDDDEETVVSFSDQDTDVSFIEEGADPQQFFSEDENDMGVPSLNGDKPVNGAIFIGNSLETVDVQVTYISKPLQNMSNEKVADIYGETTEVEQCEKGYSTERVDVGSIITSNVTELNENEHSAVKLHSMETNRNLPVSKPEEYMSQTRQETDKLLTEEPTKNLFISYEKQKQNLSATETVSTDSGSKPIRDMPLTEFQVVENVIVISQENITMSFTEPLVSITYKTPTKHMSVNGCENNQEMVITEPEPTVPVIVNKSTKNMLTEKEFSVLVTDTKTTETERDLAESVTDIMSSENMSDTEKNSTESVNDYMSTEKLSAQECIQIKELLLPEKESTGKVSVTGVASKEHDCPIGSTHLTEMEITEATLDTNNYNEIISESSNLYGESSNHCPDIERNSQNKCEKSFLTEKVNNENIIHDTTTVLTETFTCLICGKTFTDEFAYHFHSFNKHKLTKDHFADTCSDRHHKTRKRTYNEQSNGVQLNKRMFDSDLSAEQKEITTGENRSVRFKTSYTHEINPPVPSLTDNDIGPEILELDKDGKIVRKVPRKFRILKSSRWVDQHHNTSFKKQDLFNEIRKDFSVDSDVQSENSSLFEVFTRSGKVKRIKRVSGKNHKSIQNSITVGHLRADFENKNEWKSKKASVKNIKAKQNRKRKSRKRHTRKQAEKEFFSIDSATDSTGSLKIHIRKGRIENSDKHKIINCKKYNEKALNFVNKSYIKSSNYSDISEEESRDTSLTNHQTKCDNVHTEKLMLPHNKITDISDDQSTAMNNNSPNLQTENEEEKPFLSINNMTETEMCEESFSPDIDSKVEIINNPIFKDKNNIQLLPSFNTCTFYRNNIFDKMASLVTNQELDDFAESKFVPSDMSSGNSDQIIKSQKDLSISNSVVQSSNNLFRIKHIKDVVLTTSTENSDTDNVKVSNQDLTSNVCKQTNRTENPCTNRTDSNATNSTENPATNRTGNPSTTTLTGNSHKTDNLATIPSTGNSHVIPVPIKEDSLASDFPFKRPAPVPEKTMNKSVEINNQGKSCLFLRSTEIPKRQNVLFLNLASKKAREIEQKRRETERENSKNTKKQNVPFLFSFMFKKRKNIISDSQIKETLEPCQSAPSPSKIIKKDHIINDSSSKDYSLPDILNICQESLKQSEGGVPVEQGNISTSDYTSLFDTSSTGTSLDMFSNNTESGSLLNNQAEIEIEDNGDFNMLNTDSILDAIEDSAAGINNNALLSICHPVYTDIKNITEITNELVYHESSIDVDKQIDNRENMCYMNNSVNNNDLFGSAQVHGMSFDSDLQNTEVDYDVKSKLTQEIDNLLVKEKKKLVVSLRKLTENDIITNNETLTKHVRNIDQGGQTSFVPWRCVLCQEKFPTEQEAINHIVTIHEISSLDSCMMNYISCDNFESQRTLLNSASVQNVINLNQQAKKPPETNTISPQDIVVDLSESHDSFSDTSLKDDAVSIGESSTSGEVNHINSMNTKNSQKHEHEVMKSIQENNYWTCTICRVQFLLKIDVVQHIKMKHKNEALAGTSHYISEPLSVVLDRAVALSQTDKPRTSKTSPRTVSKQKKDSTKKTKTKETTEILILSSRHSSLKRAPFQIPLPQTEESRHMFSVKWYCKVCPNWYRLRKCCLQHVQKEHNIRGNWARFYFHNSQQVTTNPSMEICTGPHVDLNASHFCIICGRSYSDPNEIMRHVRRSHAYVPEVHRSRCILDKLDDIRIVVACDIFMDLHVYTVGKGHAKLVDKDFLNELLQNGLLDGNTDFIESDKILAKELKKILYENGLINHINIGQIEDISHNLDVYKISFREDFQWQRSKLRSTEDSDKDLTENTDSNDENESSSKQSVSGLASEQSVAVIASKQEVAELASVPRCHKCNITFRDRISLDQHILTHKVQVKFTCRLCNKNFPKLFFLLQHLEVKHNQTISTYFQFVVEHEEILENDNESKDETDVATRNLVTEEKLYDCNELEDDEVETTETRSCFVCGKNFETRVTVFTHMKEKHGIYKRKCLKCNKSFQSRSQLQKHFGTVHDVDFVVDLSDQLVRCYICDNVLENRVALTEHLLEHKNDSFDCNMCEMKYTSGSSLRSHKKNVHWSMGGTRSCKICEKMFTNMKTYEAHMVGHFYDFLGPMKCSKCNLTLKNKKLYKQHIASHGVSTVCEHCGKVCTDQHALRHHVVTHKLDVKCEICGKDLNKYSLKNHLVKVHGERLKIACHLCGKLINKSYMKSHIEDMHNVSKSLKKGKRDCDICGKVFKRPGLLKQHVVVHTGEKPYKCEVCGKGFGYKTALNTHYSTHQGFKPHKCQFCDKSFWLITQCKEHMKEAHDHSDKQLKYECSYCDKRYKHVSGLHLHMDEVHPEKVSGAKMHHCHKCKKEFKYRKSLREHVISCTRLQHVNKTPSNVIQITEPSATIHTDTHVIGPFQDLNNQLHPVANQTPLIHSNGSIQTGISGMEGEQQIIIQEEIGDITYQTIYIQSDDPGSQPPVYLQDGQNQLIVQDVTDDGQLIVSLPDGCGEYNVDFLTSGDEIAHDGDISYAEIVVQNQ